MFRVRRRFATRLSAALATTGLLAAGAIATAAPAAADEQNPGGATATLANNGALLKEESGSAIIELGGKERTVGAGLFQLDVDGGGSLKTYCIDIFTGTKPGAKYRETSWEQSSLQGNKDAGKILWILKNSYPQVNDLAKLADAADVPSLNAKQAAAGTQVAIWRLSDHVKVKAADESANKLADYLEKNAQTLQEPKASLALEPAAVSGKAGEKLGPIKVSTSASNATVALDQAAAGKGVKVVDKDGKPVTSAVNGSELYLDVPADAPEGSATLTVKVTTELSVGRAFTSIGVKSQTQILAGTSASTVEATATANWGAADHKGPLPAVTAEKNCVKGGLDITVDNTKGTQEFVFSLGGKEHTIGAGKSETVFLPVKEDEAYKVEISLPDGGKEVFEGVLDCKTESTTGATTGGGEPSSEPSPASAGGSSGDTTGPDLAETGSSSATPVIAGIAVALVVVGGAAVFLLRKRKSAASE